MTVRGKSVAPLREVKLGKKSKNSDVFPNLFLVISPMSGVTSLYL